VIEMPYWRAIHARLLWSALPLLLPILALAQTPCQPAYVEAARNLDNATRYRQRPNGERCEGFYSGTVSNRLELLGLFARPLRFDPSDHALTLAAALPDRAIAIVGQLIPSRRYWRLDARLPANAELRWPTRLLTRHQRFRADQVGLYGRLLEPPTTAEPGTWLVPIAVRDGPASAGDPQLLLRTPTALSQVLWRAVSAPGLRCGTYADDWQVLLDNQRPRGFGAGAAIRIPLPDTRLGPSLCMEVQADPRADPDRPLRTEVRILR
jgi:hypothetical protein